MLLSEKDSDAIATDSEEEGSQGDRDTDKSEEEHYDHGERCSDSNGEESDE